MRHGQSSFNAERRIQGRSDESTLTDAGRIAASQVGTALSSLHFDAIYTSPLQRARETALAIQSVLAANAEESDSVPAVQTSDNLLEIDLPLWEKMQSQVVEEKYPDDYRCWKERPHEFYMLVSGSGGVVEHFPVLVLYEQARQFWQTVLSCHAGGTILVVAHNGIGRALISTAVGFEPAYYHSILQSNCGINVLNFSGGWGQPVQLESLNLTTHLGQVLPQPRDGVRGLRFLLVRHGETEWNRQQRFQGQIDVPLNEGGREQSRQAAALLKDIPIDFAASSPMLRPKETAEIILQHHPTVQLELYDGLREISHGQWEGKLEAEIEQSFPGDLQRWKQTPESVQMPGGENLQQVWERVAVAWKSIVDSVAARATGDPVTCLVVAHDAVNKALLCQTLGLGPENFWTFKQGNGAVSTIDYRQGNDVLPSLQAMNMTTHLAGGILDRTAAGAL